MLATRRLRELIEPYHAGYLAPQGTPFYDEVGLKGGWMRYFAARSSPLGPATSDIVLATFYGFHRRLINRAIPDAWTRASPQAVIEARLAAADAAVRASQPQLLETPGLPHAVGVLRRAAEACAPEGRPLFAAHASLPWPDDDHLVLWWAATLLREHRGDGHVALLVARDVPPCESLVWHAGTGELSREWLQQMRGWDDDEWTAATETLIGRGWVAPDGALTDRGVAEREALERDTDQLASQPWRDASLDCEDAVAALEQVLAP